MDSDKLLETVNELIRDHTIFRVKGFLAVPGKPMRQVIQGVGERITRYYDRPWGNDEARQSRVVLIGKDLDGNQLREKLTTAQV